MRRLRPSGIAPCVRLDPEPSTAPPAPPAGRGESRQSAGSLAVPALGLATLPRHARSPRSMAGSSTSAPMPSPATPSSSCSVPDSRWRLRSDHGGYRCAAVLQCGRGAAFRCHPGKAGIAQAQHFPFPVLLDRRGEVFRAFNADNQDHPTTAVLRPNQHVMAILRSVPKVQITETLAALERLAAERGAAAMTHHPPVLMVPDVLNPTIVASSSPCSRREAGRSCRRAPASTTSAQTTRCAFQNMAAPIAWTTGSSTETPRHCCTGVSSSACCRR